MPKISVIIPCYNHGQYLEETIDTVLNQTFQDFEIIVVNDGSTCKNTIEILNNIKKPKTRLLHTKNQGLSMARNNGIKQAQGEYILPLDSDDKIHPTYLEKALNIIELDKTLGVVTCKAELFEAQSGEWLLPDVKMPDFLLSNRVFCTSLFRKKDWEKYKGYKKNMKYGWEDYDFWLNFIEDGKNFHRIEEILFYYRKDQNSMAASINNEKYLYLYLMLFLNHHKLYSQNLKFIYKKVFKRKYNPYRQILIFLKFLRLLFISRCQ